MTINLNFLEILDAIDRRGSFAAAAQELDKVPSALSYLVRKMEDDLDVLLFDRRGHKATLTAAGQELLRQGRYLLQAADDLERQVRRVATGWEVELRIAVDGIICFEAMLKLVADFYAEHTGTRLRLFNEVLSGTWDALLSGRADLAIGTAASTPGGSIPASGYQSRAMGEIEMVFAVAPRHPLAQAIEPIRPEEIKRHRAVAVGDTARNLPAITVGLLRGQDVLTVPSMQDKIAAQVAGLGCGYLPLGMALPHIEAGRLVAKLSAEPRYAGAIYYSWASAAQGKALAWFVKRLEEEALRKALLP
jgi:DNA-binding transcriptional LysR family regulator